MTQGSSVHPPPNDRLFSEGRIATAERTKRDFVIAHDMVNRLTLHTTLDPDVPFAHEATLASTVATAKTSRWLAQQHYTRYGHCNFSPAEALSAFLGLVASGAVGRPEAP